MITPIVRVGKLRLRERNRLVPGYTRRETEWSWDLNLQVLSSTVLQPHML